MTIPSPAQPISRSFPIDPKWYDYFRKLGSSALTEADVQALVDAAIEAIPGADVSIFQTDSIQVTGNADDGYAISLRPLEDSGTGALLGVTRDIFGRISGTTDATITGTAGEIDVADGDAVAGPPTLSLADVPDSGTGTFKLLTRDAKGRLSGTADGTTSDVPEGANLYYTDARAVAAVEAAGIVQGDGVKKVKVVAGVIRNTGSGWALIVDGNHDPLNVTGVSNTTTAINVSYAGIGATRVISFVCGPDERMAQAGMTCGASVTTSGAGIWIGAPLTFYLDPVTGTFNAPAWFDPATFSLTGSGATRSVNHPEISSAKIPPVFSQGFVSSLIGCQYAASSYTTTKFDIQSVTDLAGLCYYNGTAWVISTGVDTSVHTISAAWEATNGGQLRVTHPDVENVYAVSADGTADGYSVVVNGGSATSFTVKFFDSAGVQVASPVSPIGIRFVRPRKCRAAALSSARLNVSRGYARIDPTLLTDAVMPLANIWFVGVFEVP